MINYSKQTLHLNLGQYLLIILYKKNVIFPILRKGPKYGRKLLGAISFEKSIGKILTGVLNERPCRWVNEHRVLSGCVGQVLVCDLQGKPL